MARMFSPNEHDYSVHRVWLLQKARQALLYGIQHGHPPEIELDGVAPLLREKRATFVTLEQSGCLRGCIGHVEATQPLILDVVENTVAAALEDPRFRPLSAAEISQTHIAISILTSPEPVAALSERDFVRQLQPGIDGIILQDGRRRATFLPSVWEELPEPSDFIKHLKLKAGWAPDYWSSTMKVFRYTCVSLSE